ncbi:hypothetical protein GCM10011320_31260 [Neoroseomonas lacus]|uniref:Uncharacterized protein n=1 Tax=Neoroseomonas lacus TaxID=287609 RepID=A0A917KQK5_9PROT|nr:hypothetical protein GCM10011320_31260 [Neoroseomonas lacus]
MALPTRTLCHGRATAVIGIGLQVELSSGAGRPPRGEAHPPAAIPALPAHVAFQMGGMEVAKFAGSRLRVIATMKEFGGTAVSAERYWTLPL